MNILALIVENGKYKKELWDNLVALCLWWIFIITQKGLSKQSFSVGATAPVPEIPSGYVHIAYMALNSISLWNSQKKEIVCAPDPVEFPTLFFSKSRFCCRYIITQKKPQQMPGLRPLPPWCPNCGLSGGDILLFILFWFVVCYLHFRRMNRMTLHDDHFLIVRLQHSDDYQTRQCNWSRYSRQHHTSHHSW